MQHVPWDLLHCSSFIFPLYAQDELGFGVSNTMTEKMSHPISVDEIEDALALYYKSKGGYCLSMDKSEFMKTLPQAVKKIKLTSVEVELASQLFDELALQELKKLKSPVKDGASSYGRIVSSGVCVLQSGIGRQVELF